MSFNRSLLSQITKEAAEKKKSAKPKSFNQQKIGNDNPYYIDKSDIAGKGAFAKQFIPKGSPIDLLHQINQPGYDYDFTQLGRAYNHSDDPNTINRLVGNQRYMVANQDIYPGQELTGDYRMQPDLEQPQEDWKMKNGGQMIKRADGHYSKRGLWDNIRANKGSGKKPTKQMLEQERRIKAKMQGGGQIDLDNQALQGLGNVFSTIGDVMSIPARGVVKALTGKYQDPSEALGVTNPVAAWLTNSVLDPTNLVGAGVAAKVLGTAGKASKVAKIAKGVDKVAEASRAVKIPAPRNISSLGVPHKEIVNALAERGMMLDQRGAFKKAITPDDVEYFGTYGGRPVVGVNTPIGPEYFYKSTSWGGKKLIKPGDWQTFGQWVDVPNQVDNWFVKGDGYENLYGSQTFKNIAGQMDNVIMQKYGVPKQDLDKFLNFQNIQGNVDTFVPPRKKEGGQTRNEREMVNGIADILSKVKDPRNRAEIAAQMQADFKEDDVTYDPNKFMQMAKLKYGGVPYTAFEDGGWLDQYQEGGEAETAVEEAAPAQDPTEYTGSSIVDYLTTLGFESSKGFRKQLAKDMGIQGYNFSSAKNLELLNALKEAKGLPIGYEESFDPVSAKQMMALEQQRGAYVPMPGVIPVSQQQYDSRQTPAPVQEEVVNQQPVVVKRPAPAKPIVSHPLANNSILRYPGPAAPVNPYAGMYNPRVPLNSVPAGKAVPVASKPQFFDPRIPQNTVPVQQNRPVVAPTNVVAPVSAGNSFNIPMAGQQQFPGMYNQQAALASIKTALAPKRTAAAAVKNKVTPAVIKPEIVKLNNVDETNEENGKAWYENIADTFSNAVKNAPYDFSKIGLGSTGPNPHFDREALQHMIVNAAKLVSPEKGVLADNYFKRQALKNNDNLQETKTKFEVPKVGKSAIVTGDTISIDKDRYVIPAMIDLNQTKWGVRNRDEYKDINTEAGDITTFQSFENAKDYFKKNLNDPYNSTYVGVDAKGNVKVGNRIDFSGTDYRISKTFGNKIVDFVDEPNGSMKLKPTSAKASNRHLSPVVKVIGDDGVTKEGSMNLLIPKKSKDTHSFGQITGGRVIFKTPKGEQYLVSGSAEDIKKAFKQIKGNNPYVEAVTLDNGSYAMGLRNKNQKITADQLRAYQGSNSTGSAFLYLQPGNYTRQSSVAPPAAAAPKFQFKDVQMKTPNIRTEKDESFKKGHPLKNEQKAIILHHTGYSDASGIDKGMSAAMKGVNQQFSKPGESSHIVIDFDGTRYNYARPDQVTFHAGKSLLNGRDNVNDFGIGIEFQGDTDRKHLTDKQINSFVEYIAPIIKKNKIPLSSVVTHKMIRKDYMKSNPQDKDVYSKPDLNEYDYKRILKALKDKKVYKFGGSTTSNWLENYN